MKKITYPKSPPQWINQWLEITSIVEMFPNGVKLYYFRKKRDIRISAISWNENGLKMHVDSHWPTWNIAEDGSWSRRCTCGHPELLCTHLFIAAVTANTIFLDKKWIKGKTVTSSIRDSISMTSSRVPMRGEGSDKTKKKYQSDLFENAKKDLSYKKQEKKIEVEADCKTSVGNVLIRVYRNDGKRHLCKMREIYNMSFAGRISGGTTGSYSDEDLQFLKWFKNETDVYRQYRIGSERNAWKVTRKEFDTWLEYWEDKQSARFIERDSQQIISKGQKDSPIHFELKILKKKTRLSAFVTSPAKKKVPFCKIAETMAENPKSPIILDGVITEIKYPIQRKKIWELFAKKNPTMPTSLVAENLPLLLDGRIDIVKGPGVKVVRKKTSLTIFVDQYEGSFIFKLTSDDNCVYMDSGVASGGIELLKNKFVITVYDSPGINETIQLLMRLPEAVCSRNLITVPATDTNARDLIVIWELLPQSVIKKYGKGILLLRESELLPQVSCQSEKGWTNFNIEWKFDETTFFHSEVETALKNENNILHTKDGNWLRFDLEKVSRISDYLKKTGLLFGTQRVVAYEAKKIIAELDASENITYLPQSRDIIDKIRNREEREQLSLPKHLAGVLRHYQEEGFNFLQRCAAYGVNPVIADDMGLGKTLQALAYISARKSFLGEKKHNGTLIVCPASVIGVWIDEVQKFSPELTTLLYRGLPEERIEYAQQFDKYDIIVTNYEMVRNDLYKLNKIKFDTVILDEAQKIRNPKAQISVAIKKLNAEFKIVLTGTPLENHLTDLWSIMDFLNPGFFGTIRDFKKKFPVGRIETDSSAFEHLHNQISPLMLRRTKDKVAPELPTRTEEIITIDFSPEEQKLYNNYLKNERENLKEKGMMDVLALLTRLRQICCHTSLVPEKVFDSAKIKPFAESAKLFEMMDMIATLIYEKHSVLVFSSFTSMLQLIQNKLEHNNIPFKKIIGATPLKKRTELVKDFSSNDKAEVFLLSLKAAGTGLTLTKADYVFIFDPWWNPAVERQAIDRTHRIGQENPVIAYRLVIAGTIEESIIKLQKDKQELFDGMIGEGSSVPDWINSDELIRLLNVADIEDV
ncbi:MAG: DEAD/DEAH box helicase [Verrucomicrobiota bacterium]|nr:DEAD/DEAH box helicase [Verrucomicrobiota bacterium]